MVIQKIAQSRLKHEYNILCQRLYPLADNIPTPFGSTYCVIETHNSTSRHNHHEGETFIILKGEGRMTIQSETENVSEGDVILIPPFSFHKLENTSNETNLEFLSIYWENPHRAWESEKPKNVLLFSAPPTPNGDLHVGHLSGPYIAADVCKRFLNLNAVETFYVSGSDDHQSYVPVKGKKLGLSSDEVIQKFDRSILNTLSKSNVTLDYFLKSRTDSKYQSFVQSFFLNLIEKGALQFKDCQIAFCNSCNLNLYEAHIGGSCPYCNTKTNGNGCEQCGIPNDCVDLRDPQCNHCGQTPVFKNVQKYYFPLNEYKQKLAEYYKTAAMPTEMAGFCSRLLAQELDPVSATHFSDWGISAPRLSGQVIYEWLEMAAGYLYIADELSDGKGYKHFWANPESQVIQAFGFDNSFFYLAFIPALMLAYDSEIKLPTHFLINQFYLLDQKKFSTSRQHAIWGDEMLEIIPADILRLYLAKNRPEGKQTNFTVTDFSEFTKKELLGVWRPVMSATAEALNALNHTIPANQMERNPKQRRFVSRIEDLLNEITEAYQPQSFSLNSVGDYLCDWMHTLLRFYDNEGASLYSKTLFLSGLRLFAHVANPTMPQFSDTILKTFGETPNWPKEFNELSADTKLGFILVGPEYFTQAYDRLKGFSK